MCFDVLNLSGWGCYAGAFCLSLKDVGSKMEIPDLRHLAASGSRIALRVTPRASRARLLAEGDTLRAYVTSPPDAGKANAAVQVLLAKALGVPKTRLRLVRGHTSRDKVFEIV